MVLEALDNTRMKLTAYTIFWLLYCYFFIGYSSHFYGWDAYFHLTTSKKMALNGGVLETFPWVTDSVWNTMYFDKEWFFHWVNMVFLPFGDFESGKITILFFNMFVPAGMYYLLKSLHVRNVWFWMLLFPLMAYASFILRMTALRPHIVSVPIFLFSLGMIIKQKKIPFFFITILYTLSYTGSWQIFFIAGLWDVLRFFFLPSGKLRKHRKLFFPMFMVAFLGILVGTLIHPSFPHNIKGLWYQNVMVLASYWDKQNVLLATVKPEDFAVIPILTMLKGLAGSLLLILLMCFVGNSKAPRWNRSVYFMGYLVLMYFVLTHRSARFIEYLVPTLLVLAALMDKATATTDYLWKKKLALPLIIVALLHGLYMSSLGAERRKLLTNPPTKPHYLEAGRYLNDQLGDGDIIYTPRWAAAARLFYHNQNKRFIFFLDPFFMYQNDEKRFNLFQTTNLGMQEDPLAIIQNDFNASAIFFPAEDTVFTQNKKLFEQLRAELGEPWRSPEGDAVFILKQ